MGVDFVEHVMRNVSYICHGEVLINAVKSGEITPSRLSHTLSFVFGTG
jgi:hypothetical protein